MKVTRILALGFALALAGCGSDEATGEESDGTTGNETGSTTDDTTGDETASGDVTFTVGSYAVNSQRSFATEACEGESEPSELEGIMTFHFQDDSVMAVSFQVCFLEGSPSSAITEEACEAEGGSWFTDEVSGTWSIEGLTIDMVIEQSNEDDNTETVNLTCNVESAEAILCFGIETEETVDLQGNVIESVDRCLELSLGLVAN
jgi:hypothetical protein